MMRVGSLVYATEQGLGRLAKAFYDHGVLTDALVVRHGRRPEQDHWFPGQERLGDVRDGAAIRRWLAAHEIDCMLFFETPFDWGLVDHCKRWGIATALMPMHECMPREMPALPDLFVCPSQLDLAWAGAEIEDGRTRAVFIPVPVEVPWRLRERCETFVHNAGWGGLKGRNGTAELYAALPHVKSNVKLILRTQEPFRGNGRSTELRVGNVTVDYRPGTFPAETLWEEGDCFVFPEGFNGLSLPLQEARAAGMLVMAGDRFPMNRWLPRAPLIPVSQYRRESVAPRCAEYDRALYDPRAIAAKIDEWYGANIRDHSLSGKAWAETMSWAALEPVWTKTLEDLVHEVRDLRDN